MERISKVKKQELYTASTLYDTWARVFRCSYCNLKRYQFGKEAKLWGGERLRCKKGCGTLTHKGRMSEGRAVHLNKIRRRETGLDKRQAKFD